MSRFKVITLCGSTKFKQQFEEVNARLTMGGNVVISVGVFGHANNVVFTEWQKEKLDEIHFQKIDMADEVFVINVGGYIGSSTKREIEYAQSQNKPVSYLEDERPKELYQEERSKFSPLPDADTDFIALDKACNRYFKENNEK